jgi:hypothetical protein
VTLPLSYSPACSLHSPPSGQNRVLARLQSSTAASLACPRGSLKCSSRAKWVAREGLEPSKPLGRQIYSLLRLTASLPRQRSVLLESVCSTRTVCCSLCLLLSVNVAFRGSEFDCVLCAGLRSGAGEGIRTPDLLITNQLLYRPELRQPKQKWNYSTSYATGTIPTVSTVGASRRLRTAALANGLEEGDPGGD